MPESEVNCKCLIWSMKFRNPSNSVEAHRILAKKKQAKSQILQFIPLLSLHLLHYGDTF